jgi:homoserine dehydrogenase
MMHGRQAVVMKDIKIGLLGFGTVGAGVVHGLRKNGDLLAARLGVRPVIARIADLDLESDRGVTIDRAMLTSDAFDVVHDPDVDVIVELIGGTGVAREVVLAALKSGKPVVTANKALLAEHGEAVFGAAREHGVDIYFGAAVGGGIPIIRALREGLTANRVESIFGILNGTCNYILTRMEHEGLSFDDALQAAQEAGP